MKISVFGLGYVGSVMMGCLCKSGHQVMGVDVQPDRVKQFLDGESPVIEPGVQDLIAQGIRSKRLSATSNTQDALTNCEVCFICVGTPSSANGSLNLTAVESVCREIATSLKNSCQLSDRPLCLVIRSTVMPGTTERCLELLQSYGPPDIINKVVLCVNPEFLREGSAVADFMDPPYTLVGASDPNWAEPLRQVYHFLQAPFLVTSPKAAEILKMISNCWHATKICFANEVGRLCKELRIDSHEVMDLFLRDSRLNLSDRYLHPGFAFGGSCLPKDVLAINHLAEQAHMELPLLQTVTRSNQLHLERTKEYILSSGCKRVGFLGLSFKPETDDLRGSPHLALVEFCLGKGLAVRIFDPVIQPDRLVGSNQRYVLEHLGHIAEYMVSRLEDIKDTADLIVIGHQKSEFTEFCKKLPEFKIVLDLVGIVRPSDIRAKYVGLCW